MLVRGHLVEECEPAGHLLFGDSFDDLLVDFVVPVLEKGQDEHFGLKDIDLEVPEKVLKDLLALRVEQKGRKLNDKLFQFLGKLQIFFFGQSVSIDFLERLAEEFLAILDLIKGIGEMGVELVVSEDGH